MLGSPIQDGDRVVLIEDVTTAGTSIQETLPIIRAQGDVQPVGLVVSVDRMDGEPGQRAPWKRSRRNTDCRPRRLLPWPRWWSTFITESIRAG